MKILASIPSVTLLGVPPSISDRTPFRGYVPPKINREALHLWHGIWNDESTVEYIRNEEPKMAWYKLIQSYYDACQEADIKPTVTKDDTINDSVRRSCMDRRLRLRIYLDRTKLFEGTKIIPDGQSHKWTFLRSGNLKLTAQIALEHDGLANLRQKVQHRFAKMFWSSSNRAWEHSLLPDLKVSVCKVTRNRMLLKYELIIHAPFYIPERCKKQAEKRHYLDTQFFYPMIRGVRFKSVKRRIQF